MLGDQPSALGMLVVMVLKMLTRTRNIVMRSVILRHGLVGGSLVQYPWSSPAGHHVRGDEEADPGDHDEHAGGEVARDDVVRHLPGGGHGDNKFFGAFYVQSPTFGKQRSIPISAMRIDSFPPKVSMQ